MTTQPPAIVDFANHIKIQSTVLVIKSGILTEDTLKSIANDTDCPAHIRQAALKQYVKIKLGADDDIAAN